MYFKKFVGLIIRELISRYAEKDVTEVTEDDYWWHAQMLRDHRGGLSKTVREVFDVLFRSPPKSPEISDFVGAWIRQPKTLINVSVSSRRTFNIFN